MVLMKQYLSKFKLLGVFSFTRHVAQRACFIFICNMFVYLTDFSENPMLGKPKVLSTSKYFGLYAVAKLIIMNH